MISRIASETTIASLDRWKRSPSRICLSLQNGSGALTWSYDVTDLPAIRLALELGLDPNDPFVFQTCRILSDNILRGMAATSVEPVIAMPAAHHKTTEIPHGT